MVENHEMYIEATKWMEIKWLGDNCILFMFFLKEIREVRKIRGREIENGRTQHFGFFGLV